ncbi:hypothetical protein GCM10023198_38270 [Promicromonospora umidemergens]|uniref:Uncharacterized protein n=1 Tax=Promicromonospora umidemergens TaxID=629679 RepID=A0ABP8XN83_9MICO
MRRTRLVPHGLVPQVLVLLAGGLLAGCAAGPGSAGGCGSGAGARAGDAGFAEVLALPAPTADYAWYPGTVTAALPSVTYTGDGAGDSRASELAAVGRFTGWAPGDPAHPSLQEIDLTFEVDEVVDSLGDLTVLEGGTVTVHVSIDGCADVDRVAEELLGLDDLVLFLNHVGPEPWPPPEWVIVFDGAFLGDVHGDGAITWPVAEAIAANNAADHHPEADAGTLDGLRAAAAEERTVDLSTH